MINVAFPLKHAKYDKKAIREKVSQRVAIARAVVKSPDILLADEPTGALDKMSEYEVLKVLNFFISKGLTFMEATHSDVVAQLCKSSYVIEDHKIKCVREIKK